MNSVYILTYYLSSRILNIVLFTFYLQTTHTLNVCIILPPNNVVMENGAGSCHMSQMSLYMSCDHLAYLDQSWILCTGATRANTPSSRYLIWCYGSWSVNPCLQLLTQGHNSWWGRGMGHQGVHLWSACTCCPFPVLMSWVTTFVCVILWFRFVDKHLNVIFTTQIHWYLRWLETFLLNASCHICVPTFCYPCIPKRLGSMWALSQTRNFFPGTLQPQSSIWYQRWLLESC